MNINSLTSMPWPANGNGGVVPPELQHPARNTGIVPSWLERDLGFDATHPTTNPSWRADFTR